MANTNTAKLADFAANVLAFARSEDVVLFGDRKAFITTVLEAWYLASPATCPRRADFGALLVAAHQAQHLTLARADLVSAMDPELVKYSEVKADGATFHFVVTQ